MLKNAQFTLIFLTWPYALKNCGPRSGATQAASMESASLRRLVGVARGPSGAGPDLKQLVLSAQGRP